MATPYISPPLFAIRRPYPIVPFVVIFCSILCAAAPRFEADWESASALAAVTPGEARVASTEEAELGDDRPPGES